MSHEITRHSYTFQDCDPLICGGYDRGKEVTVCPDDFSQIGEKKQINIMRTGMGVPRFSSVAPPERVCSCDCLAIDGNGPPVCTNLNGQDRMDHNPDRVLDGVELPVKSRTYAPATAVDPRR